MGSMVLVSGLLALVPACVSIAEYHNTTPRHRDPAANSLYALQATIVSLACVLMAGAVLVFCMHQPASSGGPVPLQMRDGPSSL